MGADSGAARFTVSVPLDSSLSFSSGVLDD